MQVQVLFPAVASLFVLPRTPAASLRVPMTTNPDPSSTDQTEPVDATAQSESASPSRRIQIGTQRAGVTPPSLAPKYQYIAPPAPRADDAGATAAAGATAEPQTASAGDAPARGEPRPEGRGPRDGGRGRRDRRRDDKPRSFADALPPARRVAVPNIRGGLDEDLEADFEAALEGVAIDALLDAGASAKAEAPIDPGSRLMATVLSPASTVVPSTVAFAGIAVTI